MVVFTKIDNLLGYAKVTKINQLTNNKIMYHVNQTNRRRNQGLKICS